MEEYIDVYTLPLDRNQIMMMMVKIRTTSAIQIVTVGEYVYYKISSYVNNFVIFLKK